MAELRLLSDDYVKKFVSQISQNDQISQLYQQILNKSNLTDSMQNSLISAQRYDKFQYINQVCDLKIDGKIVRTYIQNPVYFKSCKNQHPLQTYELSTFILNQFQNDFQNRITQCQFCESNIGGDLQYFLENAIVNTWLQEKFKQVSSTHQYLQYYPKANIFVNIKKQEEQMKQFSEKDQIERKRLELFLNKNSVEPYQYRQKLQEQIPSENNYVNNDRIFCMATSKQLRIPIKTKDCHHSQCYDYNQIAIQLQNQGVEQINCSQYIEGCLGVIKKDEILNYNEYNTNIVFDTNLYLNIIQKPEFFTYVSSFPSLKDPFLSHQQIDIFSQAVIEEDKLFLDLLQICQYVYYSNQNGLNTKNHYEIMKNNDLNENQKIKLTEKIQIVNQNKDVSKKIEIPVRCINCRTYEIMELRKYITYIKEDIFNKKEIKTCPICKCQLNSNNKNFSNELLNYTDEIYVDMKILFYALNEISFQDEEFLKYNPQGQKYIFEKIQSEKDSYEFIKQQPKISYENYPNLLNQTIQIDAVCPFKYPNKIIQTPVKSINCKHIQCMDIENLVEKLRYNYQQENELKCPVKNCKEVLREQDMRIDQVNFDILKQFDYKFNEDTKVVYNMKNRKIVNIKELLKKKRKIMEYLKKKQEDIQLEISKIKENIREQLQNEADEQNQLLGQKNLGFGIKVKVTQKKIDDEFNRCMGIEKDKDQDLEYQREISSNKNRYLGSKYSSRNKMNLFAVQQIPGLTLKSVTDCKKRNYNSMNQNNQENNINIKILEREQKDEQKRKQQFQQKVQHNSLNSELGNIKQQMEKVQGYISQIEGLKNKSEKLGQSNISHSNNNFFNNSNIKQKKHNAMQNNDLFNNKNNNPNQQAQNKNFFDQDYEMDIENEKYQQSIVKSNNIFEQNDQNEINNSDLYQQIVDGQFNENSQTFINGLEQQIMQQYSDFDQFQPSLLDQLDDDQQEDNYLLNGRDQIQQEQEQQQQQQQQQQNYNNINNINNNNFFNQNNNNNNDQNGNNKQNYFFEQQGQNNNNNNDINNNFQGNNFLKSISELNQNENDNTFNNSEQNQHQQSKIFEKPKIPANNFFDGDIDDEPIAEENPSSQHRLINEILSDRQEQPTLVPKNKNKTRKKKKLQEIEEGDFL